MTRGEVEQVTPSNRQCTTGVPVRRQGRLGPSVDGSAAYGAGSASLPVTGLLCIPALKYGPVQRFKN